jgi:LacI family transcriptional regulator
VNILLQSIQKRPLKMINTTLKTISDVLGISISTVSRALKNHPDISEKTKKLVTDLAQALDYEPNVNAIHLRTSKSNVLGLMVPSISNFFYHSFIAAVEEECRKNNLSLMILQSGDDPEIEVANLKLFRQTRISGLFACITTNTQDINAFLKLKELDIPVIFFDKVPDVADCNKVCVADEASATLAAEAILARKKKKLLAIFGNDHLLITRKRLVAFNKAINGRLIMEVRYANNAEEAEDLVLQYLVEEPDSIFCMSDEILTGAMKAIQKKGTRVPADLGIIGISNGFIPTLYYPEITYVETSGFKLGKLAFSAMSTCMQGSTFVQELTAEAILVEGGSL